MMKHTNEILTAAMVAMAAVGVYVLFNINIALGDHDKDNKSHPEQNQAIAAVNAKLDLIALKSELNQKSNEAAHDRQEETGKYIRAMLEGINRKL